MSNEPLKPCPFCGNINLEIAQPKFPVGIIEWYVDCIGECQAMIFNQGTKEEIIEKWNKRV